MSLRDWSGAMSNTVGTAEIGDAIKQYFMHDSRNNVLKYNHKGNTKQG